MKLPLRIVERFITAVASCASVMSSTNTTFSTGACGNASAVPIIRRVMFYHNKKGKKRNKELEICAWLTSFILVLPQSSSYKWKCWMIYNIPSRKSRKLFAQHTLITWPLTMTFCRSGWTPDRAKSCALRSIGGSSVFTSTPSNFSLPHLIFTKKNSNVITQNTFW